MDRPSSTVTVGRFCRLLGHAALLLYVGLSVALAPERVIFRDSAVQLFEMIQRRCLVIYDGRYTMGVTQLLPLLAIRAGLGLKVIVAAYSVAAPLLAWVVYCVVVYGLKDTHCGLLLVLPLLCFNHTFFHAISESCSMLVYASLLLALLRHTPSDAGYSPRVLLYAAALALATAAVVFIHPVGLLVILFLAGYQFVDRGLRFSLNLCVMVAMLLLGAAVRFLGMSGHDAGFIPSIHDVRDCLLHFFNQPVLIGFLHRSVSLYIAPLVMYVAALLYHARRRSWLRLACGLLFNVGFFLLTVVVYRLDGGHVNVERAWAPLVFFAAVPFVCELLPSLRAGRLMGLLCVLAVLLFFSAGRVVHTSRQYSRRLAKIEEVSAAACRSGCRKLVAPMSYAEYGKFFGPYSWATSFESMLASSLHGPRHTVNIYVEEQPFDPCDAGNYLSNVFFGMPWWKIWNYDVLDPRYFMLPEQPFSLLGFTPSGSPSIAPMPCAEPRSEDLSD